MQVAFEKSIIKSSSIDFTLFLQSCVYKVIPEFGAMSGVRAKWLWLGSGHEFSTRFEAPNLDYTATIGYRNGILRYQLVNITYPEFEIKLVRKYRSHLIETIVPTGLLVAISWVITNSIVVFKIDDNC